MTRVNSVTEDEASPKVKLIYNLIKKNNGRIPNIFLNMGNAPSVLEAFISLSDAASHSTFTPLLAEKIALAVSQTNQCNYCLSAHTALGKATGLNDAAINNARKALTEPPKEQAILQFAKALVEKRGKVTNEDISNLKKAGVNNEEMLEIVLHVMVTMFTNYFNHVTDPQIDFPEVKHESNGH